ncbi:uncharacterized protein LOC141854069 [Brevipalpus obovatus]|uniref:uncharacterized protein LOC141854069 n=1 Tax=Brevipalpus obovatus TaxID=246614 RepID=UPI003D9E2EA6
MISSLKYTTFHFVRPVNNPKKRQLELKMAKYITSLIVFSMFGALVNAYRMAEEIANGFVPAPLPGQRYDYVAKTVPEILIRNNLPNEVNQAIDQNLNDVRASGGRLYPHGLPDITGQVPSLPRIPQQSIPNRAPAQPKRVEMRSPANFVAETVPETFESDDNVAQTIADGLVIPKPAPLPGPRYDYVAKTVPEILIRNNLPNEVNQAIDQNLNDVRASGCCRYPHGLPDITGQVPSLPRIPQQSIPNRAPAQPKRVEMRSPANFVAETVPAPSTDNLAADIATGKGRAPLVESIRARPHQAHSLDNLAYDIVNSQGLASGVSTSRGVESYSGSASDNLADTIAKRGRYDNLAEEITRSKGN